MPRRRFELPEKRQGRGFSYRQGPAPDARGDLVRGGDKRLIRRAEKQGFVDELFEDEDQVEARRRKRLAWAQRGIAAVITLPFAIWIAVEGTGTFFPQYAWLLPLAGAYYLGLRIGGVVVRGWTKAREQRLELPHELDDNPRDT